jgi:hypothetical protein
VRNGLLRTLVLTGTATALLTEALSPFHLIARPALIAGWLLLVGAAAWWVVRHPFPLRRPVIRPLETVIVICVAAIVALLALTAWLAPPNTFDALAYHMPRIVYWAQARSVAFFPTTYLSQIGSPPLDEYLKLHAYVLWGGDRLVNLVGVAAFAGCIVGVSAIAGALGLSSRGQACAALLCATLPSGILQASGPKNDCLTALWLVCLVYFALRADLPFLGLSLGLAVATKGTAYLFAPPLLAAGLWIAGRQGHRLRGVPAAAWLLGGLLLVNAPQYARNLAFSGSPLGYDAPFANGVYRWRNEHPGWKLTISNALRHLSEQLGSGNPRWNRGVYQIVLDAHRGLGMDPQGGLGPSWSRYPPPANTRHEANANNRWHLLLLMVAALYAVWMAWRRRELTWAVYSGALLSGFLLFCWYLRWQEYSARLFLPLFIVGAPLAGWLLGWVRPALAGVLVCLLLLNMARLPLLENWTRPLRGPHNLFAISRTSAYFLDVPMPDAEASYRAAVDAAMGNGCRNVGIDAGQNQLEYPLQALLRQRDASVRLVHAGVTNSSLRYALPHQPEPCAVITLTGHGPVTVLGKR